MEEIGLAVIGTGFGCLTHVRAAQAAGLEVRALVGRNPERTADRAKRFSIPAACTSVAEAVALPGVDAVAIATPPHTHAPLALEAIAAGKHVVCEKPFTRDAAEARTLLDAAEAAGIVHLLGTEFRWSTGQAVMARAIASGAIGDPRLAVFMLHMPLLAAAGAEVPDWWSDAEQGGGWLGAHAAHTVDQVRDALGEFESVSAALPRLVDRPWTVEDTYSVRFHLHSGVDGILQSSAGDWGPIMVLNRVAGTGGTVWAEGDTVRIADAAGTRTLPEPEDLPVTAGDPPPTDLMVTAYDFMHSTGIDMAPFTRLYRTFGDLIAGRPVPADPRPATFADGVAAMAVLDAIRRSAREGRSVEVPQA
jgi:predicted dehydrogenase